MSQNLLSSDPCPTRPLKWTLLSACLAAVLIIASFADTATTPAHPGSWGMRVDQQVSITVDTDAIQVRYVTQLNRQAAYFLEVLRMDTNGDDQLSTDEQTAFFHELARSLSAGLEVSVNGRDTALRQVGEMLLSAPTPDQLRKEFVYQIPQPSDWKDGVTVEVHNENYLDYPGSLTIEIETDPTVQVTYDSLDAEVESRSAGEDSAIGAQQRDVVLRYHRDTKGNVLGASEATSPRGTSRSPATSLNAASSRGRWLIAAIITLIVGLLVVAGAALIGVIRPVAAVATIGLLSAIGLGGWGYLRTAWCAAETPCLPDSNAATQIFQQLHRQIYRAFDENSESAIYDTLSESLDGRVLEEVYFEVYDALRQHKFGATRFRIRRVKPLMTEVVSEERPGEGFCVRYRWRVYGVVSHYGHTHARFNEYEAIYQVGWRDSQWKIVDCRARQNRRVTLAAAGR